MRNLIEAMQIFRRYAGVHFHGTPDERLTIDPLAGTLFTDFDAACDAGSNVFECQITLHNAYFASDEDDFAQSVRTIGHEQTFDGIVLTREHASKVIVFNQKAAEIIDHHDASCDRERPLDETNTLYEFAPEPGQHIVLVTGELAKKGLQRVMEALGEIDFTYEIRVMDIAVAAWLTVDIIAEQIGDLSGADVVVIPGKVMGDEAELARRLGLPVLRGPGCYSEIPTFLEREGIEIETEDNVRPKILVLSDDPAHAKLLADTYEVPLIDREKIEAELEDSGHDGFDDVRHNIVAEIVRALLIGLNKGFVIDGYPRTERDARWLSEMTGLDIVIGVDGHKLVGFYEADPEFWRVSGGEGAAERLVTAVETRLRSCVFEPSQDNSNVAAIKSRSSMK